MRPSTRLRRHRGGAFERLSAADASNVVVDSPDQVNVFLIAGLLSCEGFVRRDGTADLEQLRAFVEERIADPDSGLQRLRQRVVRVGGHLVWQDASSYDGARHVRVTDPVDGRAGLERLAGRLMTVAMSLEHPLWEILVVPGADAESGAPGVIVRMHHAVADGLGGIRLVQQLLGAGSAPPRQQGSTPPRPRRGGWRSLAAGVVRVTALLRPAVAAAVLLGPISHQRGIAFTEVDLGRLADAVREADATVNDALLAAVTAAIGNTLSGAGEPLPETLPVSVPVALPDRGTSGNAVGVMVVPLPLRERDQHTRLAEIARATRIAKQEARTQGTYELTRTRAGTRAFAWLARRQHFIAAFVTNVRGPERPLHLAGAALRAAWPVAPLQGNVRFGVAALSYAGRLAVTVHTDAGNLPSTGSSAAALSDELQRLSAPTDREG